MVKLHYGSGDCSISGESNIQGLEIRYTGAVEITKTCGDDCLLTAQNNGILIVSLSGGALSNLFTYTGEIEITSVLAADNNAQQVSCYIKKVMDYSEFLNSKSEDMTEIVSEDLSAGHTYKKKHKKTRIVDNYIKNQQSKGNLYLEDGTAFTGAYHIHLDTGKAMTGAEHSKASEDLYTFRVKDAKYIKTGITKKTGTRKASARAGKKGY